MRSVTLAKCGIGCGLPYAITALLGGSESVAILSGTLPASGASGIILGLLYVLAYFAAVVVAPVLLFAAAALRLRELFQRPVR